MSLYCESLEAKSGWFGFEDMPNKLKRMSMEAKSRESYIQIILHRDGGATSGLYRQSGLSVINFLLSPEVLEKKIGKKPALINPLKYYEKQRLSL